VVTHSIVLSLNCQYSFKNGSAPEITPVSKPNNSPPVAAIIAINKTFEFEVLARGREGLFSDKDNSGNDIVIVFGRDFPRIL